MEQLYIAEKPAVAAALADFFSRHGNKFTKENGHFISIKKDSYTPRLSLLMMISPRLAHATWM